MWPIPNNMVRFKKPYKALHNETTQMWANRDPLRLLVTQWKVGVSQWKVGVSLLFQTKTTIFRFHYYGRKSQYPSLTVILPSAKL